ncbi:GumC family protein [Sphingomonas azotifigens]|uniref:GumC family protein n=1 Tax=Sphingomonas azotifigens TaxID=330920 RepID=UPI00142F47BF|nr:polysaccharide biosynthesis tyrosine autokinase [Sphingomonas azotifigens]
MNTVHRTQGAAIASSGGGNFAEQLDEHAFLDAEDQGGGGIDVRALGSAVYRSRWYVLAIIGLGLIAGVGIIMITPPLFRARASVEVSQQSTKVLGTEETEPVMGGAEFDRFLQTQVNLLESRALAARVAANLRLAADDRFLVAMGDRFPQGATAERRQRMVTDLLQKNLRISLMPNSRIVEIVFTSRDSAIAMRVANSYSENYIQTNIERKFSTTAYSREFLSTQLAQAKQRLEGSERELIEYSRAAKLIDASGGADAQGQQEAGPRSLTTANLVNLNEAYIAAEARRIQTEERWRQAGGVPLMSLPEVLSNPAIQALDERRAELLANLGQLRQRLQPDHPAVAQATAQLNSIDRQLNALAVNIKQSLFEQQRIASRQAQALAQQVAQLKENTLSEQDRSVRYNILKREVDTSRQLYDGLLQRYKEVSAEAGAAANNVIAVDTAEVPKDPVSPRVGIILVLGLIGGLAVSALFVFAREQLDDSIRDPQDLEPKLHLALLGVVPKAPETLLDVHNTSQRSAVTEAYQSVRTAIELSSPNGVPRSLLLTSSRKGEGKTTSALFIAKAFADIGRQTLLIDGDLRKPSLHGLLGVEKDAGGGLSSLLARRTAPQAAILPTGFENLSFIPSGPPPPNAAQLLGGAPVADLLHTLQDAFDVIIVDGPPVLALADAIELASQVEATLFVVAAGGAHYGQAKQAARRVRGAALHLIGGLVTKHDPGLWKGEGDYYMYDYG